MLKNYIGISRDHSASMRTLSKGALKDYNSTISAIKDAAETSKIDTIVSVVSCGVGPYGEVKKEIINSSLKTLDPAELYSTDGGSTPLFDSVGALIEIFENVPDKNDPNVSFLIQVITDGQENSSKNWSGKRLGEKIKSLQATDHWTFVFRVPFGYKRDLEYLGIPNGNIFEWEQTDIGLERSTIATTSAFQSYYSTRATGIGSTKTFYANPVDLTQKDLNKLDDISSKVVLWPVTIKDDGVQIKPFCEKRLKNSFMKGAAFYQLTKTEKAVQDYKIICIRDKKTQSIYGGHQARRVLGLPLHGTIKLAPGDHGQYDIFVQSTSINRKLVGGTQVLYWEH